MLALSQAAVINTGGLLLSFIIIHLMVYPASNGYNSYIDRDESAIGGLERPPLPTKALFYVTLLLDVLAPLLAFIFVSPIFSGCIIIYSVASRAYSSRLIRLKRYPILAFLTVFIFQGGFTYFMSSVGISKEEFAFTSASFYILLASSFQIAGAYPLTQIYQHKEDLKDGVLSLSYKLGYKGTFIFTAVMFGVCNVFYYLYFVSINRVELFYTVQLFFVPIIVYFVYWFLRVLKNAEAANFKNTMRMNLIAAICMNTCFVVLCFNK